MADHYVLVRFTAPIGKQEEALEQIGRYVESFLRLQPGFRESTLLCAADGQGVVHFARWRSEADFQRFAEKARSHPDLPALRAYDPQPLALSAWAHFAPGDP